ncbi:MFS transporter [Bdellovibrio bacteriovorus]|uniref:Major facilitator superfamily, methyl viologen resistance protein n=1 Tax=Bdellovibrio bacteriovorus str. Tiberius TaxID=1069642 RepID=K7Z092_BDEBC|nr:MFS transporter [Bdellovibrio bacteriovorus]AFY02415.1 major facilitator superfamily, methyl viologen resistance protein [Bdellovibrio bacteriovorus str. Tiberius]
MMSKVMENTLKHNKWLILFAALLASLPVVINMTTLHVAIPTLTTSLQASGTQVLWIIDIYALMMSGLLIPMGTLADRVGGRKMILVGLTVFLSASFVASWASSANFLIFARAATAFGAAMIMPSILSIIRIAFDNEKERALALGAWATVGAAGGAIGPLIGGYLLTHFSWSYVFLMNVPLILIIIPFGVMVYPKSAVQPSGKWAFDQALLLIVGLISCIYAVKSAFKADISILELSGTLALGALSLFVFFRKQKTSEFPLLDLELFKKQEIRVGLLLALVVSGAMAGVEFTIAQELQFVFDKTPLQAGSVMLPLMLATGLGGPVSGYLVGTFGVRLVATVSLLVSAACLLTLTIADFGSIGPVIVGSLFILGLSLAIGLTASSIAIMNAAPPEKAGAAGSIEAVGYELGMGLGITFFGLMMSASYRHAITQASEVIATLPKQATLTIGDTMIAAKQFDPSTTEAILAAAKTAFSSAHQNVLVTAGVMIALVGIIVFVLLGNRAGGPQRS